jgi:hypothetical protein
MVSHTAVGRARVRHRPRSGQARLHRSRFESPQTQWNRSAADDPQHARAVERASSTILSSSPGDVIEDKLKAAHVHADGYFTKPMSIDDFLGLGKVLRTWYEQHGQKRDAAGKV